jgi:hypothetical protein
MNSVIIRWLTFLLSVVALVGFVIVYRKLLATPWTEQVQPKANFEFLASSLTGLVGGIVAAAFGQKLPDPPGQHVTLTRRLNAFGKFMSPFDHEQARKILAAAYVLVYIAISIWAIVVWAGDHPYTPKLTNNLAVVSIGLFAAIVTSYFGDSR